MISARRRVMWEKLPISFKYLLQLPQTVTAFDSLIYWLLQHFNFSRQVTKELLNDYCRSLLHNVRVNLVHGRSTVPILLKCLLKLCLELLTHKRRKFDSHQLLIIDARIAYYFTATLDVADIGLWMLRTELGTIELLGLLLLLVDLLVDGLAHHSTSLLFESGYWSIGAVGR